MKKLKELTAGACCFTVAILSLFYIFAAVSKLAEARIGFSMFALILFFSCLISVAGEIFKVKRLNSILKTLVHYLVLLFSFCIIFIVSGNIGSKGAAAVFSAVAIFTFFYICFFLVVYFVKAAFARLNADKSKSDSSKNKDTYRPLYKNDR